MEKEEINKLLDDKVSNLIGEIQNISSSYNLRITKPITEFSNSDLIVVHGYWGDTEDYNNFTFDFRKEGEIINILCERDDYYLASKGIKSDLKTTHGGHSSIVSNDTDFKFFLADNYDKIISIAREAENIRIAEENRKTEEKKVEEAAQNAKYNSLAEKVFGKKETEYTDFTSDPDKMRDFAGLSREGFLTFYSYLTIDEYNDTLKSVDKRLNNLFSGKDSLLTNDEKTSDNVFENEKNWVKSSFPDKEDVDLLKEAATRLVIANVDFKSLEPENFDERFDVGYGADLRWEVSDKTAEKLITDELKDWKEIQNFVEEYSGDVVEKQFKDIWKSNVDWSGFTEDVYNKVKQDIAEKKDGRVYGSINVGDLSIDLVAQDYPDDFVIDTRIYYPDLKATYGEDADGVKYDEAVGLTFSPKNFDLPYEEFKEYFIDSVLPKSLETDELINKSIKVTRNWKDIWQDLKQKEVDKRINDAYDVYKDICGDRFEKQDKDDKKLSITNLFANIKKHYESEHELIADGQDSAVPEFIAERQVGIHDMTTLIKGIDAIRSGVESLDFIRPDEKALEYGLGEAIPFDDLVRGYGLFQSTEYDIPLHIERWDTMGTFPSDFDAAKQWEKETGERLLVNDTDYVLHDENLEYFCFPDSLENREKLATYIQKHFPDASEEIAKAPETEQKEISSGPALYEPCKVEVDGVERICKSGLYSGLENALKLIENLKEINQSLVKENKQLEKKLQQFRSNSVER